LRMLHKWSPFENMQNIRRSREKDTTYGLDSRHGDKAGANRYYSSR